MTKGANVIKRKSSESSVTIPFLRTYSYGEQQPQNPGDAQDRYNYCGCGWPDHLLIPKGTTGGLRFNLFVMISNFEFDKVVVASSRSGDDDKVASSYCGLQNKPYPDQRSMGYPFDRVARAGVNTLADFLTPNMYVRDVNIYFTDTLNLPKTYRDKTKKNNDDD